MALDYDTANTGIFAQGGPPIKAVNDHLTNAATTLPAQLKNIADKFEAADRTDLITGLYGTFAGMQGQEIGNRQAIASVWDRILSDPTNVLNQLGVLSADPSVVLPALYAQMVADSKTIKRNTVTLGTMTAASGNVGNGTILVSKVLDGYNAPVNGGPIVPGYIGLNSELAVSETMRFEVTRDSYRDGITAGQEQLSWQGGPAQQPFSYLAEGSGIGPGLRTAIAASLLTNGDFETFASNAPSGWTISAGTAGSHIFGTTTTGEFYRNSSGLKFTGDGSTKPYITQSLTRMKSRRAYWIAARVKADAAVLAGDLNIKISGTSWAAGGGTSSIAIAFGALPTSWTLYSTLFVTPAAMPTDMTLDIGIVTANLTNAKSVYVDDVCLVEAVYHGGVTCCPVQGSTPFVAGDKWALANTQDDAGLFQSFMRRKYKWQGPSASSPAISEGLVA